MHMLVIVKAFKSQLTCFIFSNKIQTTIREQMQAKSLDCFMYSSVVNCIPGTRIPISPKVMFATSGPVVAADKLIPGYRIHRSIILHYLIFSDIFLHYLILSDIF